MSVIWSELPTSAERVDSKPIRSRCWSLNRSSPGAIAAVLVFELTGKRCITFDSIETHVKGAL